MAEAPQLPRKKKKRPVTAVGANMSETSLEPSVHREGFVVITLSEPIKAIREVLIDPKSPAISAGEIRMMQAWCSDLLHL